MNTTPAAPFRIEAAGPFDHPPGRRLAAAGRIRRRVLQASVDPALVSLVAAAGSADAIEWATLTAVDDWMAVTGGRRTTA
jgi:hypothetical protein